MSTTPASVTVDEVEQLSSRDLPRDSVITEPHAVAVASQVWNAQVTHQPAAVVRCSTTSEVQAAVRAARAANMPLSVLGGGHDWNGSAVREGGLVVDLSRMREVDIEGGTAQVQGGALVSDLLDAALEHGYSAVVGTVGSVGVTGSTLGGGYGALIGVAGLAVDNVLSAEVVLADGRVVIADAEREPELFWALRGGGGNFGIVTRLQTRLHPVSDVTTGQIAFGWDAARSVLAGWQAMTADADDALDVMFGVMMTPAGRVLFLSPTWSGEPDESDAQMTRVRSLGDPVSDQVGHGSLAAAVHAADGMFSRGHYRLGSRILPALTTEAIHALVESGEEMPDSCMLYVHHAHGAATRVRIEDTAHAYRVEHLIVEILGIWGDGDGASEKEWVRATELRLNTHALPGGWAALMARGDARARDAFGSNTARLMSAKAAYDPDGVFVSAPLPARASS